MNKKRAKGIYWGLVLIALAVFAILKYSNVDIGFIGTLPITSLILAAVILAIAVGSCVSRNFWALPLELAAIFMVFEPEIAAYIGSTDPNLISNWLLLGCAVLISVGVGLIFPTKHKHVVVSTDDNSTRFSSQTKYIDCTDFADGSYSVRMGEGNLYFENIENFKGNAVLNVECKMGDLTIHVPAAWQLETNIESTMGDVTVPGTGTPGGPLLTINGSNKMGDITVVFC